MIWPKSSWYRVFAFPKGFLISKGNNIFKIPGNPRPTCLPSCGMPLGLGQAFLSPLILRLFWQQPIESYSRKTARNTYTHISIRWITFHWNIICYAATFHSVSFSKPNPVWFGKVTLKNCIQFSKPIPVWFGKKKIDFARRIFQTKFRMVWKILMTIINVLKIPNQYQFGLEKSLTIANTLNLKPIPVLLCKI